MVSGREARRLRPHHRHHRAQMRLEAVTRLRVRRVDLQQENVKLRLDVAVAPWTIFTAAELAVDLKPQGSSCGHDSSVQTPTRAQQDCVIKLQIRPTRVGS